MQKGPYIIITRYPCTDNISLLVCSQCVQDIRNHRVYGKPGPAQAASCRLHLAVCHAYHCGRPLVDRIPLAWRIVAPKVVLCVLKAFLFYHAVNVCATFGAIAFVDSLGRRKLLIAASIWMFVTQIIVAGLLGAEFQQHGAVLPSSVSIGVIVVRLLHCWKLQRCRPHGILPVYTCKSSLLGAKISAWSSAALPYLCCDS